MADWPTLPARADSLRGGPANSEETGALARETRRLTLAERRLKRVFDLLATLVLMVPALPLSLAIALAIALDSRGPIVFRQQRLGENGRRFWMYKFRSMLDGAEEYEPEPAGSGEVGFKHAGDPRITRVGRWLRRTSLDELPQLLNVLRGEMSLVGPRPELPWIAERFYEPWQYGRLLVPQGMTGWWQVTGRSDRPMYLKTQDDLYYIEHYTFWLDLWILLRTVGAVVKGRGAY